MAETIFSCTDPSLARDGFFVLPMCVLISCDDITCSYPLHLSSSLCCFSPSFVPQQKLWPFCISTHHLPPSLSSWPHSLLWISAALQCDVPTAASVSTFPLLTPPQLEDMLTFSAVKELYISSFSFLKCLHPSFFPFRKIIIAWNNILTSVTPPRFPL